MAVGAPMQARPQTASLVAYQFGQFPPGLLEVWLTASDDFPSEVNRVRDILSGCGRSRAFAEDRYWPWLPIVDDSNGSV